MDRRNLLKMFVGAGAAILDPDKLLWRPGKLISIPAPKLITKWEVGDVFTIPGVYATNRSLKKVIYVDASGSRTALLQKFVVTGEGAFWPSLITNGIYTNSIVSDNADLTARRKLVGGGDLYVHLKSAAQVQM
jgi:hypothetical protein